MSQFWREQRRLWIWQVDQKRSHKIGHNAGSYLNFLWTINDLQGLGRGDWRHSPTNGALHPHQQAQNSGYRRCRDRPNQKPPRQWRHAAAWHRSIFALLTPIWHLGCPFWASATPRIKAGDTTLQARVGDLIYVGLLGADYMLFRVYQDWLHQNPGNHMYGRIIEYGKRRSRWEKIIGIPNKQ